MGHSEPLSNPSHIFKECAPTFAIFRTFPLRTCFNISNSFAVSLLFAVIGWDNSAWAEALMLTVKAPLSNVLYDGKELAILDLASICLAAPEYEFRHIYYDDTSLAGKIINNYERVSSYEINRNLVEFLSYGRLIYLAAKNISLNQISWGMNWLNKLSVVDKNAPNDEIKKFEETLTKRDIAPHKP
jgi:hypothetical protein